jgi:poly(A) polymerase
MLKFNKHQEEILGSVYNFAKANKVKLYLVGGALRDLILREKKETLDFDFCLRRGALNFGRKLAKNLKAAFVVLDEGHAACRLVKKIRGQTYTFDLSDFRAETLEKDLLRRDFTINSLALQLKDIFIAKDLSSLIIDPYSGRSDLRRKVIKATGRNSFKEDPLRILRAFSFSCILKFSLDRETLRLAKKERDKIRLVSIERIREELFKILDSPAAYTSLAALDKLRILEIIFPEIKPMRGIGQGSYHHLDVWQHSLETLYQFELILKSIKSEEINNYLKSENSGLHKKLSLLKLACILHDVGKPKALRREKGKIIFHGHERIGLGMVRDICRRLRLSNEECRCLERIVLWHLRPGYLADNQQLTKRAIFRYFRDTAEDALGVLLLSLADQRATKGPLTTEFSRLRHERLVRILIRKLLKKNNQTKPPRLVNGHDIMNKFKLPPSVLVGKVLDELEEAQAIGKIKDRPGALALAAKIIKRLK